MKLKQLVGGVATGYVTKAVQFVASMALVPFLLRPEILGVDDYGRAFTLVAFMGIGTVITAGIRLSFVRSISQAVGESGQGGPLRVGRLLGSGTVLVLALCAALAIPALVFRDALLDFVRFPDVADYRVAILYALLWMTAENGLFLFRAPLMARGAISYVNFVTMAEVVLRTGTLVLLLPGADAPLTTYFVVQFSYAALRSVAYSGWSLLHARSDYVGLLRPSMHELRDVVGYSGSLTLAEGSSFLVRRVPIMLASRYLGATEAGFIALVINTIQDYVLQILFAVVQPLAVPIAARFDPRRISASARAFFFDVEGLYCSAVIVVIGLLMALAPDLILVWLGEGYDPIVLPAQIMLAGCGIDIMYSIRKSLLIGQGLLPEAIGRILGFAVLTAAAAAVSVVVFEEWTFTVFAIGGYFVCSNVLGVGSIWARHFIGADADAPGLGRFAACIPVFAVALGASQFVGGLDWQRDLLVVVGVLGCALAVIGMFILSARTLVETLRRLVRSLDRDVFSS